MSVTVCCVDDRCNSIHYVAVIAVQVKVEEIEMETPIWPPEDVVIKQENVGEEEQGEEQGQSQPERHQGIGDVVGTEGLTASREVANRAAGSEDAPPGSQ